MIALNDMSQLASGSVADKLFSAAPLLAEVKVDFDRSVLLQMALFAVLVAVLKPLLFDPMLKLFALREEKTEGAKAQAREMQERAGDILTRYEKELSSARQEAGQARETTRKETVKLEAEIIDEARAAVDAIADSGRESIQQELQQLKAGLEAQSREISVLVSKNILGRDLK
jgi:F-type H+-transporting ATPase subunit b